MSAELVAYPVPAHEVRREHMVLNSRFIALLAPANTPEEARAFLLARTEKPQKTQKFLCASLRLCSLCAFTTLGAFTHRPIKTADYAEKIHRLTQIFTD